MTLFKKTILMIRTYWHYALLILTPLLGYLLYRKQNIDTSNQIKNIEEIHKKELDEILIARENEKKKFEENERKMNEQLHLIQKQYEESKKELDEVKRIEIKKLVQEYSDQPIILAQKLSDVTGFKVILPESDNNE